MDFGFPAFEFNQAVVERIRAGIEIGARGVLRGVEAGRAAFRAINERFAPPLLGILLRSAGVGAVGFAAAAACGQAQSQCSQDGQFEKRLLHDDFLFLMVSKIGRWVCAYCIGGPTLLRDEMVAAFEAALSHNIHLNKNVKQGVAA